MIANLLQNVTGEWSHHFSSTGIQAGSRLTALKVGALRGKDRKINFLIFEEGKRQPVLILKCTRSYSYQERLRQEYQALTDIAQTGAFHDSVPAPLGMFQYQDHLVTAESCLPGALLTVLLHRQQQTREETKTNLQRGREWIVAFQNRLKTGKFRFNARAELERRIDLLHQHHEVIQLPPSFVTNLFSRAEELGTCSLPLVACHGDYWAGNFLVDGDRIGIIDWESYRKEQWPFIDAFLFVATYARIYHWGKWNWQSKDEPFSRGFFQHNWFSGLLHNYVSQYLRALDLPPETAHLFFSLFLIEKASSKTAFDRDEFQSNVWLKILEFYAANESSSIFVNAA